MTGKELKFFRINKRVKLCEISKVTGISSGILSNYESEYRQFSSEQEEKIVKAIEKIANSLRCEL